MKHRLPFDGFSYSCCGGFDISADDQYIIMDAMKADSGTKNRILGQIFEDRLAEIFVEAMHHGRFIQQTGVDGFWKTVTRRVGWTNNKVSHGTVRALCEYLMQARIRGRIEPNGPTDDMLGATAFAIDDFCDDMRSRGLGAYLPNIEPEDTSDDDEDDDDDNKDEDGEEEEQATSGDDVIMADAPATETPAAATTPSASTTATTTDAAATGAAAPRPGATKRKEVVSNPSSYRVHAPMFVECLANQDFSNSPGPASRP
jgi:hypothetical protein